MADEQKIHELEQELHRLRVIAPLFSEGAISPTQYNRMSDGQKATYHRNVQKSYQIEDELRELKKSDSQRDRERKDKRRKQIESRLSQIDRHLTDMNHLYVEPRVKEGKKPKPSALRDIENSQAEKELLENEMRSINPKRGPIASATRMITGVGEYVMSPVKKLGGKADRALGKAIGHNPKGNMTNDEVSALVHADDSSFGSIARRFGFDVEGPSARGSFLVDDGTKVWLFSSMRTHGRTITPSVWSPLNVSVMRRENPSGVTFTSKSAAQQYARLIQHELKDGEQARVEQSGGEWVVRTGWPVMKHNPKGNEYLIQYKDGYGNTGNWIDLGRLYAGTNAEAITSAKDAYAGVVRPGFKLRAKLLKRNPESDAASMYEKFHGKESEAISEFIEEEHYHGHLAALGQLIELKVYTITGLDATFCFDYEGEPSKGVILASNEEGTALYAVGGDQSLDLASVKMDKEDYLKDSMVIGDCYFVSYFTEKDFDNFENIVYEHELGEETGELPVLRYDRLNERLYIDGGAYCIKKPLLETSPGIEN